MKTSKLLVGFVFVGAALAACTVKTKETSSGSTGSGGSGGATSSVTAGPTTTTTTSSTSSGGSGCDDGTMDTSDSAVCSACLQCAAQSTCADQTANCQQGSACADFDTCRIDCISQADANQNMQVDDGAELDAFYACFGDTMKDPSMAGGCIQQYQQGFADWADWFNCIFGDCPNNCGTGGGGGDNTPICESGFASSNKACADCLTDKCCAEFTACGADQDCMDCIIEQDAAKCGKSMKDEAANNCASNKCASECAG